MPRVHVLADDENGVQVRVDGVDVTGMVDRLALTWEAGGRPQAIVELRCNPTSSVYADLRSLTLRGAGIKAQVG